MHVTIGLSWSCNSRTCEAANTSRLSTQKKTASDISYGRILSTRLLTYDLFWLALTTLRLLPLYSKQASQLPQQQLICIFSVLVANLPSAASDWLRPSRSYTSKVDILLH
ncbi:uncharacterized protein UV8b_01504 [Ustilaginoidea virens]|uniref:Uncharacterized protein n=1 Tax=Ustilaginoidea virens TaxID=1159556 RepID=A0A8E5HL42_USTVR|nr:uncharacterized protein UV8b_01504 [Ustilaginoidea virens]QUC17263.1 hypothetical protein UV8b_01504 [Ustilaginoidea virens]